MAYLWRWDIGLNFILQQEIPAYPFSQVFVFQFPIQGDITTCMS